MKNLFIILLICISFMQKALAQKVGINNPNPLYELDVSGYSGSDNQVSIIPLRQSGANYIMTNTSGADLSNCESAIDPLVYTATGDIEVKLVVRIFSTTAGTNNFQLRTHNGVTESFPILNTDSWTFAATQTGIVAVSPWKSWAAGSNAHEMHLYGWVDGGSTSISSAYLIVRPKR